MRIPIVPTLAALLVGSLGQAQFLINDLSFGYEGRVSPINNPGHLPNFIVSGQPIKPEVLSTKVILTPLAPGNSRGAIWSEKPLKESNFVVDVDFRANGPERARGNMNIWLVRNGHDEVGAKSAYGAGKFEGLVLVVDTHAGSSGMLRGFLNDGDVDYSQHHNVDELAFGHCPYAYRNMGRPSQIKLRQSADRFQVEIDGKLCFETSKFRLPTGYHLGITASTPNNPDSFEVFKVVVMSEPSTSNSKIEYASQQQVPKSDNNNNNDNSFENLPDENADVFQTSKTQFQDLHNRLQATQHQLSAVYRTVSKHHHADEKHNDEVKDLLNALQTKLNKLNQIGDLQRKIESLENEMRKLRSELTQKMTDNEKSFRGILGSHHASLSQKVVDNVPGHGKLIIVIVGTQVILVAAYVLYKRRRTNSTKKYL